MPIKPHVPKTSFLVAGQQAYTMLGQCATDSSADAPDSAILEGNISSQHPNSGIQKVSDFQSVSHCIEALSAVHLYSTMWPAFKVLRCQSQGRYPPWQGS